MPERSGQGCVEKVAILLLDEGLEKPKRFDFAVALDAVAVNQEARSDCELRFQVVSAIHRRAEHRAIFDMNQWPGCDAATQQKLGSSTSLC